MYRQFLAIFISILINSKPVSAQQSILKSNTIYTEMGGNGLFLSINYERQIFKNINLFTHTGIGIYGIKPSVATIPFGVRYITKLRNSNSYIDFGVGATYAKTNVTLYVQTEFREPYITSNFFNLVANASLRHITKRNFMYRFSVSPIINEFGFLPFLGFSFGKTF